MLGVIYPDGITDAAGDALLEAFLVHLRLLDDFFGSPKQCQSAQPKNDMDDVFARHWLPGWTPRPCLNETQRSRVNAQLQHLSARRRRFYEWKVIAMASRCCRVFNSFLAQLEQEYPKRVKAFERARTDIAAFLSAPPEIGFATTTSSATITVISSRTN